jgi:hypothetical protein
MSKHDRRRRVKRPNAGLTVGRLRQTLGRCGMSIGRFDIEQVTALMGAGGRPAYGASPHDGRGRPILGRRGRPLILLSRMALCDMRTAVVTVFHEVAHHRSFQIAGHGGSEVEAEQYGLRMFELFAKEWR